MTNDKTSNSRIYVVYKTLKASDPLPNLTKIKQHMHDLTLLYTCTMRLSKFLKPKLCPHSTIQIIKEKYKTLKDKFLHKELVS
jgi:hypothetical protein